MAKGGKNINLSYNDLLKGCEFEQEGNIDASSSDDDAFDDADFARFKEKLAELEDAEHSKDDSFEALKLKMTQLTDDGLVLKKLVKWGNGITIAPKSTVLMHYNAYIENEAEPFDSTYRRNRPYRFLLGEGKIIPGLDLCIGTMKNQEISKFIISPEYGYGKMGCPPRIPGNANLLYEVEILNVLDSADVIDYEDMTPEEQKQVPFAKITAVRNIENKMAADLFSRKLYKPAIARYRKLVQMLEDISVKDEEEDKQRQDYLLKAYLNLSQCYLNVNIPKKALKYADLVLQFDENNTKALYRKGKGLILNSEFDKARKFLHRAKQNAPFSKEINAAIIELEKCCKKNKDLDKLFAQKALGFTATEKPKALEEHEKMNDFQETIEEIMVKFIDSVERELPFSAGYTEPEIRVIEIVAKKYNLAFVKKIHDNHVIIKVCKN